MSKKRKGFRIEKDSLGEVYVPNSALYGAQTQRAIENFPISGIKMNFPFTNSFIDSLGIIKDAAARANKSLGLLSSKKANAISKAAKEVWQSKHNDQFPIDVFQTGSGTSNPWWSVDLGSSFALSLVKIVHRTDCCKARMNGAMVYSTDENSVTSAMQGTACGTSTHSSGGPETIQCPASATPGRHVFVVIPGDGKIVQMCEFEAYGQLVRPIPLYVDTQAGSDEANGLTPGSAFATQSACREALQNGEGHVCRWSTGSEGQTQWELTTSILP